MRLFDYVFVKKNFSSSLITIFQLMYNSIHYWSEPFRPLCFIFFVLLQSSSVYGQPWIPPQYPGVDEEKYENYTSMLRISDEDIKSNNEFWTYVAWHNTYVAYMHLKAPIDTVFKYVHFAINSSPYNECENIRINTFDLKGELEAISKYEAFCVYERCREYYQQMDSVLMRELVEIKKMDDELRVELDRSGNSRFDQSNMLYNDLWRRQLIRDSINQIKIARIIEKKGYPGNKMVGNILSEVPFLVIQHAPLEYQKKYMPVVYQAVREGQLGKKYYAYLLDRVNMFEKKNQIYGTQVVFNHNIKHLELYPVEDIQHVDERRKQVGLEPLKEYLKEFGITTIHTPK